jgi:hypothetical protein
LVTNPVRSAEPRSSHVDVHIAKSGGVLRSVRSIAALAFAHVEHGGARVCPLCLNVRLTPPNGRCLRYAALCPPPGSGHRGEGCADFPPASSSVDTVAVASDVQRVCPQVWINMLAAPPGSNPLRQRVRRMSSRLWAWRNSTPGSVVDNGGLSNPGGGLGAHRHRHGP